MLRFLLSVSSLASLAAAADVPYWIEPCTHPQTGCVAKDVELAQWALEAWQNASKGALRMVPAQRDQALLRMTWALPEQGLYGETMPIQVHGIAGAQINIRIEDPHTGDALLRDTIVYLTCLHESGHALGLRHTDHFDDIMYSFEFGGDIPEYFARYRRKLRKREDIRRNSGLSAGDLAQLAKTLK